MKTAIFLAAGQSKRLKNEIILPMLDSTQIIYCNS